jgi:glucan 1,3-beta-glucosidase
MPSDSTGHTGILLQAGSTIAVTDVRINGGAIGIQNSNQQVIFKNIYFRFCRTAYAATGGFDSVLQSVTLDTCGVGIDSTQSHGDVILLDSTATNSGNTVVFADSANVDGKRNNQIVIQNLKHDTNNPIAITSGNSIKLAAQSSVDTWVWGNAVPGGYQKGTSYITTRPQALLDGSGKFYTQDAPTYANYAIDQIINVKSVSGFPVKGDGQTNDSASLNAILAQNAANCKITYFLYGVYVVLSTLIIPPNSRIVGEAWPVISGSGNNFKDESNPRPVVKVGNVGDVGISHISDMRFTVREPLKGAKIVEVNMAGAQGDVGIWNSVINLGGMKDSTVNSVCTNQDTGGCMAAYVGLHATTSSSLYVQNLWVWTADHTEDGGQNNLQIISTGRGILVESQKATWLVGSGAEHNWLYNYNFNNARNVYAGLLQTESPYNQGRGAVKVAPAPWTPNAAIGDPDFDWCSDPTDGFCRSSVAVNVNGGSNILLYSSASWVSLLSYVPLPSLPRLIFLPYLLASIYFNLSAALRYP